jgi:nucleoside-diphosphate-sugar epimerase
MRVLITGGAGFLGSHLSDRFLSDLSGFLNFAFDSRDLLTLWLVGLPQLNRNLRMHQHAALTRYIVRERQFR